MTQANETKIQAVIQAERDWLKAHLELDLAQLERMMADEYTQVSNTGQLLDKSQVLATFQTGQRHWDTADSDEYRIQIYGETALVYGRWRASGVNHGQPFDYAARYISLWVYRDGRWQIVSDQSTEIRMS
jgi:ketosteroid isomerase-like protein